MTEPRTVATDVPHGRCAACGALRPPAVSWCTQCFAPFEEAAATPSLVHQPVPTAATTGLAAAPHPAAEGLPPEVEAQVQVLMAQLAADGPGKDQLSSLTTRIPAKGAGGRSLLIIGGTLLLTATGFVVMTVLGSLL